jgi:hypothetical protein
MHNFPEIALLSLIACKFAGTIRYRLTTFISVHFETLAKRKYSYL